MSEPTFENSKTKFQNHLLKLIKQPIREFQNDFEVKIESITVELMDIEGIKIVSDVIVKLN